MNRNRIKADKPSPTVQTHGSLKTWNEMTLPVAGFPRMIRPSTKPPYRIPTMDEIRAIPWNGLKVASLFAGTGGSCLGYRMAGFRVVWANEFVPAAQASYRANAPDCILDGRDVKHVQPADIFSATGLKQGELDLLDGSPPCQAFSTAGKREKGWGQKKNYAHGASQCNETLFDEYIRLLRSLMPKVFVAENVRGLVSGTAKGYFLEILRDLKASGYRVICKVLDAQWLGVPQCRQRTIFVGVREDLRLDPVHPKPLPYRYSVRDALPWIGKVESNINYQSKMRDAAIHPASTIMSCSQMYSGSVEPLPPSISKAGAYAVQDIQPDVPCPTVIIASPGNDLVVLYRDRRGAFGENGVIPATASAPTIMAGTVGNLWIHEKTERRKFTIAELKRICAFPDDFILTGSYAQQWERLGNSVPPVMMKMCAEVIRDKILIP